MRRYFRKERMPQRLCEWYPKKKWPDLDVFVTRFDLKKACLFTFQLPVIRIECQHFEDQIEQIFVIVRFVHSISLQKAEQFCFEISNKNSSPVWNTLENFTCSLHPVVCSYPWHIFQPMNFRPKEVFPQRRISFWFAGSSWKWNKNFVQYQGALTSLVVPKDSKN